MQLIIGVIVLILFSPAIIQAESARSLVESGNKAYEQGDYANSLDSYDKAAEAEPDSAIVLFNRGNAMYKQGEYADAFNVYEQAAVKAMADNDPMLEAQSRYNMGNSSFRKAEAQSQQNLQMALEGFNRSSENFKSAVKLDPGLSEAKHNLEVSRMAVKQVEELIRKQQQQAQQQQDQQQGEEDKQEKDSADNGQESSEEKEQKAQQSEEKGKEEQNQQAASQAEQAPSGESPEDIISEEIESRKYRKSDGAIGYKPVDKDW